MILMLTMGQDINGPTPFNLFLFICVFAVCSVQRCECICYRSNLDPFERHGDQELWTALEKCHIKGMVGHYGQSFDAFKENAVKSEVDKIPCGSKNCASVIFYNNFG